MRKKIILVLFVIIPAFAFADAGTEKVSKRGTTGAAFLEIPVGALASGLGCAFVSVANDATSLYWNPAGIARADKSEAIFSHITWIAETQHDFGGVLIPFGSLGTLGISYTSLNMDDMKVTTVDQPDGTGEYFSASDIAIGLSYARLLSERFSVGITAKYIQQNIWHMTASAFAVDLGTLFKTDLLGGMMIGASISNFGTQLKMDGRDSRQYIRIDETKLGTSESIPTNIEMDSWDLPLYIRFGISTYAMNSDDFKILVAADVVHPNNDYESANVGTQLSYKDLLFIRAGWTGLFLEDYEGGLSLGVGINTEMIFSATPVRIDYAYKDFGKLKAVHFFSVDVRF